MACGLWWAGVAPAHAAQILRELDADGDGAVTLQDFAARFDVFLRCSGGGSGSGAGTADAEQLVRAALAAHTQAQARVPEPEPEPELSGCGGGGGDATVGGGALWTDPDFPPGVQSLCAARGHQAVHPSMGFAPEGISWARLSELYGGGHVCSLFGAEPPAPGDVIQSVRHADCWLACAMSLAVRGLPSRLVHWLLSG
eukprot:COSAG01_NODE_9870_length_2315_cov_5.731047_3_plen_198_part_00